MYRYISVICKGRDMKKCTKYEALFTFANEETLKKHIEHCIDCKNEQDKMDKVSALLKDVKPYYLKKLHDNAKLKMACAMLVIVFCTSIIGVVNFNTDVSDMIKYGNTLSADDLGLPVDSYGLLMVE